MSWLEWHLFQLFLDNLAVVLDFMILQDIHNICTFSLNIKLICTHCESSLFCLFLKLIQLNYIFPDNMHIYYIYFSKINKDRHIVIVWQLDIQLPLQPLRLWDRIPFMTRCTRYNIMWSSLSATCHRSVFFSGGDKKCVRTRFIKKLKLKYYICI